MARERYPGERRGLSLFLEDLRPAAARVCGAEFAPAARHPPCPAQLRPRPSAPCAHDLQPSAARAAPRAVLGLRRAQRTQQGRPRMSCWSATATASPPHSSRSRAKARPRRRGRPRSSLTHELLPASALRVMVSPGTLPSAAADDLRRIAGLIESDRRLLSERYWRDRDPPMVTRLRRQARRRRQ